MSPAEWLLEQVRGCTFDDFLFRPQYGVVERRDPAKIDLTARLSEHVVLRRPIVSANMDTVTRAAMAIAMAEEGGIGIIDRGFRPGDIEPQVREVEIVKRTQHGIIPDPYTIAPGATLEEARAHMEASGVRTLVVVDGVAGVEVATEKTWAIADEYEVPRIVVLNRLDRERASVDRALPTLHEAFGRTVAPIQVPIGEEKDFRGVVDLA